MSRSNKTKISILFLLLALTAALWAPLVKSPTVEPQTYLLKSFSFSEEKDLEEWNKKVLRGRVEYTIENYNGESCVYARSNDSASALYHKIKIEMGRRPILSWKWQVIKFPAKTVTESLTDREEDDYGARVYIIFPFLMPTQMKALEYVWAEYIPEKTVSPSPYTPNIRLMVLESGYTKNTSWVFEKRDLYEDYVTAFGEKPPSSITAIAVMTDSDSTDTFAEAVYDEIRIEYKKGGNL